ncbi:hypothetical protein [Streptomyces sp. NPDC001401]|uniref:hypothetical protein n=1 Tax=Streptomyces sp. NPDC001401 TaxID=3364570 RepID=UPI0036CA4ABA
MPGLPVNAPAESGSATGRGHRNAPLTPEGRLRLCLRIDAGRPTAHTKHGPARLAADLQRLHGLTRAPATVHRILVRRGLNRLRDLDPPTGEQLREVIR